MNFDMVTGPTLLPNHFSVEVLALNASFLQHLSLHCASRLTWNYPEIFFSKKSGMTMLLDSTSLLSMNVLQSSSRSKY